MAHTKYRTKQKYKDTLYPHLLMACIASECKEEDITFHPKMVIREDPLFEEETDKKHQTFIMRWNPEISNYKIVDFEHAMEEFYEDSSHFLRQTQDKLSSGQTEFTTSSFYYDWSIFDHEKVHVGDKFYMLKVGNGNTGIVMSGIIVSLPYKDEDWSGKGRDVRYVRMIPDCMVHPDKSIIISTQSLDEELPGVNWNEGHSGVLLNNEQANKFDELWHNYMIR